MLTLFRFLFLLFCTVICRGQTTSVFAVGKSTLPDVRTNKLYSDGFAYPAFLDNEIHSQSTLGYRFDEDFLVELNNFYDAYRQDDIYRVELMGEYNVSGRLYARGGAASIFTISKHGNEVPKPQMLIKQGLQYNLKESIYLGVQYDKNVTNKQNRSVGSNSLLKLMGKFKF